MKKIIATLKVISGAAAVAFVLSSCSWHMSGETVLGAPEAHSNPEHIKKAALPSTTDTPPPAAAKKAPPAQKPAAKPGA